MKKVLHTAGFIVIGLLILSVPYLGFAIGITALGYLAISKIFEEEK